jgi:ABC-2 type transport system permease protein
MFGLSVFTLWQRELLRFWREKARVLGFVASPLVFWLLIGSGFGNLGFFFPGALVLTVMFSAVFSTMSLIEDRREGFLLSMLVSPAPRSALVLGKVLGSATLAWLQGLMFLCFLPLTGYAPGAAGLARTAGMLFLISFGFTVLGFALAWRMESTQGFHAIMNLALFPLWLVSGAVFPIGSAHGWVQWLMRANPLTYMLEALRAPLEGRPAWPASLAVSAAFAAVFFAVSAAEAGRTSAGSVA